VKQLEANMAEQVAELNAVRSAASVSQLAIGGVPLSAAPCVSTVAQQLDVDSHYANLSAYHTVHAGQLSRQMEAFRDSTLAATAVGGGTIHNPLRASEAAAARLSLSPGRHQKQLSTPSAAAVALAAATTGARSTPNVVDVLRRKQSVPLRSASPAGLSVTHTDLLAAIPSQPAHQTQPPPVPHPVEDYLAQLGLSAGNVSLPVITAAKEQPPHFLGQSLDQRGHRKALIEEQERLRQQKQWEEAQRQLAIRQEQFRLRQEQQEQQPQQRLPRPQRVQMTPRDLLLDVSQQRVPQKDQEQATTPTADLLRSSTGTPYDIVEETNHAAAETM